MATIDERTTRDGKTRYRALIRLKGFPPQSATFERKTDARRWVQQTEAAIREGRHFKTTEAKRHTLAELVDRYCRDVLPTKPRSEKKQRTQLEWWKGRIGSYLLADVTPALIAEQRDFLAGEKTFYKRLRGSSSVNRYLAALSHAFTIAVKEWGWIESSPIQKVRKLKEPRGRVRFLAEDERARLLDACRHSDNTCLYPVVVLALSTGARKMEILSLNWDDVDLNRRAIVLHQTKNGERRTLPLSGHALDLITELSKIRHIDTNLLFPGTRPKKTPGKKVKPIDIRTSWEAALRTAKISDFRFHDLRHSCASYLAMSGASMAEIAEVLGHKTLQMVKRYAHLSEQHTSGVVARMNDKIFNAVSSL